MPTELNAPSVDDIAQEITEEIYCEAEARKRVALLPDVGDINLLKVLLRTIDNQTAALAEFAKAKVASVNDDNRYSAEDTEALARLVKIGLGNTGQSRRVANFLLAWWNATDNGGFDFTDLWNVDLEIAQDMLTVFALIANRRYYADAYGFEEEFRQLVTQRRRRKRARKAS